MNEHNNLKLVDPWSVVKEKIKESNIELTDADLIYEPGGADELLDHLAKKMNMSQEEIRFWIESVSANKGKAS
jgi:hypothetical protein